jgi:hypothetical protein
MNGFMSLVFDSRAVWQTNVRNYILNRTEYKEFQKRAAKGKEKRASRARLHGFGCPPGIHADCK